MKILNKFIVAMIIISAVIFGGAYFIFLHTIPNILNSPNSQIKYSEILTNKIGYPSIVKDFEFKTYPNLSFEIKIKDIVTFKNTKEKLININNIEYSANLLSIKNAQVKVNNIYVDINTLKNKFKQNDKKNTQINLDSIPKININKLLIVLDKNSKIIAKGIETKKNNNDFETTLIAQIYTPYTESPITIGQDGKIILKKYILFDKFSIQLGNSKLHLSGDKNKFLFTGKNISARELASSFLYFYKLKYPNKKNFIENFSNFKGTLDVNLSYDKTGFWGECITKNLSADFWTRKIAVQLPYTIFDFKGREITAQTSGTFGYEPVTTDFYLKGLATHDLHIEGNIYSKFTNKIAQKYFPELSIKGITDPKVKYIVNNQAVDVFYTLGIPKGNNLLSIYGNLDNNDKYREITAHTYKNGETIYLKSIEYKINGNKLLTGIGTFEKENGNYKPATISVKTNGEISINTVKSFLRNYLQNGTFNADINFQFKNKIISGSVNLYDVTHADFLKLDNTSIKVENDKLSINSKGTFYNFPITATFSAENTLEKGLIINDIDIHLKKFILQKGAMKDIAFKNKEKKQHTAKYNIEIKQGKLRVDEIYHKQFDITNIDIQGSLKNNIVNFVMPKAEYAGGLLSAKGKYDVIKHNSDIQAFASEIDSDLAATRFFKLKDQIQGIASAAAHLRTKNKINEVKADVVFAINDGFLPKLGSKEFIISKAKNKKGKNKNKHKNIMFTLSKISNIDFSKPNQFYSNLYGGFTLDNGIVKDAKIYSKSDFVSMYIEGNYDIETEYGNIFIWGRHNKTAVKKIRILKIPINLIYKFVFKPEHSIVQYDEKIKQIPPVKANITDDVSTFRVHVSGEINSDNKIKVELKDLR